MKELAILWEQLAIGNGIEKCISSQEGSPFSIELHRFRDFSGDVLRYSTLEYLRQKILSNDRDLM